MTRFSEEIINSLLKKLLKKKEKFGWKQKKFYFCSLFSVYYWY